MTTAKDDSVHSATRREFLRASIGTVAGVTGLTSLFGCATALGAGPAAGVLPAHNGPIEALAAIDVSNGGAAPFPIPWLDKNGSHNQSPGPGMEPSNIFHFRGNVARSNDFSGMGTDNTGRRIAFGARSTDFSVMAGEYFAGRQSRRGAFGHI